MLNLWGTLQTTRWNIGLGAIVVMGGLPSCGGSCVVFVARCNASGQGVVLVRHGDGVLSDGRCPLAPKDEE